VRVTHLPTPLFEPEVALHQFEQAFLSKRVSLCVCVHVSNVFGYVLPVERLAELCAHHGIPLVVDASQSAGLLDIKAEEYPGVYWCMPGHKGLYGPQGTGLLLCPENGPPLTALLEGGTGGSSAEPSMPDFLPEHLEAGTQNAHGIAGLLEGLRYVRQHGPSALQQQELRLLDRLTGHLKKMRPIRQYTAPGFFCQSAVLSFTADGMDSETVAEQLSEHGVCVRAGLHCAPLAHRTACTNPGGTVRVSLSAFTTPNDIDRFAHALRHVTM
jgi:selenocysteine lyase/cysteine desulfurase